QPTAVHSHEVHRVRGHQLGRHAELRLARFTLGEDDETACREVRDSVFNGAERHGTQSLAWAHAFVSPSHSSGGAIPTAWRGRADQGRVWTPPRCVALEPAPSWARRRTPA